MFPVHQNPQPEKKREKRPGSTVKQAAAFDITRLQFLLLGRNKLLISSVARKLPRHISLAPKLHHGGWFTVRTEALMTSERQSHAYTGGASEQ